MKAEAPHLQACGSRILQSDEEDKQEKTKEHSHALVFRRVEYWPARQIRVDMISGEFGATDDDRNAGTRVR